MSKKRKLKGTVVKKPILIFLAALLVLIIALIMIFYFNFRQSEANFFANAKNQLRVEYLITIDIYEDMAESVYDLQINNPGIIDIFTKGVKAENKKEKNMYRNQLYEQLEKTYSLIVIHNFRQLHFHEANNKSFLRFHRPEKYGDDLTNIRYSVDYVNKYKQAVSGFEEGRIFNGYRFVFPVRDLNTDEHLGSVEVSISLKTIIDLLQKRFNRESQFILLKKQVIKKVFKSEQSNYIPWPIDKRYVLDKGVSVEYKLDSMQQQQQYINSISEKIDQNMGSDDLFCVETILEGKAMLLVFMLIKNFKNETVEYLFSIDDVQRLKEIRNSFASLLITMIALMIFISSFGIYYYITQKKLIMLATYDSLTGLFSRREFMRISEIEIERSKRFHRHMVIMMLDIDHFKNVNDTFGHQIGDAVLKIVSDVLRKNLRITDQIGRYGGEEFVIIKPETNMEQSKIVAEKLRNAIETVDFPKVGKVTISCGMSEYNGKSSTSLEELIAIADKKLYEAKKSGRNKVAF